MTHVVRCSVVTLVLTGGAIASTPTYSTFEIQARSNIVDGFNLPANSSFNSKTPDINDAGTMAFSLISIGGGNAGLFVGAGGVGAVVHDAGSWLAEDPSINTNGLVVFERFDLGTNGIWMYDPGDGSTTQLIPPSSFTAASSATINDADQVGFRAKSGSTQRWMTSDGVTDVTYVTEGSPIAFLFTAVFNNLNQLGGKVRLGTTSNDSPDELRVYNADGSHVMLAVDDDGDAGSPYTGFDNSIAMNDVGQIAFIASLVGGGRGVFVTDGVTTTTIATTLQSEVSEISFFHPALNDSGLVAFRGKDGAGLHAVFAGDGTELRRVIAEHDLIETDLGTARVDQHDGSITFGGSVSINNHGDVAFAATLTPPDDDQTEWGTGMFIAFADALVGDIDGDGFVGFGDLVLLLAAWGPCPAKGDCLADLDGNGDVGFNDLVMLLAAWS